MSHNPPYKSETKPFAASSPVDFSDFVPPRGPSGGRNVIDYFVICLAGTITVATAAWDGRDVWRALGQIGVEDRSGKLRWQLSGFRSRLASIYFNGIERHSEHANVAIGAAQTVDLRALIPMRKRFIRRGKDFSMASDVFRKVSIQFNSLAGAATSTTVLSAPSLNCYVLAYCHEEHSVEFKCEDVIKATDANSNTQGKLALNGAVHDLFACREPAAAGTAGGDVITALTDARIEDLGTPLLTRGDLVDDYTRKRAVSPSGTTAGAERFLDPVRGGTVLPILTADDETSVWEGKVLDSMKIDLGTGVAGLSFVSREITEKAQANYNAQLAKFGLRGDQLRMKTDGKSRRGMGDGWTKRQQLVSCWSGPLAPA